MRLQAVWILLITESYLVPHLIIIAIVHLTTQTLLFCAHAYIFLEAEFMRVFNL